MLDTAADAVVLGAVVVAGLVGARTRSWSQAVPVLLELLLAAGLLRLSAEDSWRAIGGAAAVVAVRVLARTAFRRARRQPAPPAAVPGSDSRRPR